MNNLSVRIVIIMNENRINALVENNQGSKALCIEYNNSNNVVIEFQDEYKARVTTTWKHFIEGKIRNPYYPSVLGVACSGNKYPITENKHHTKEYAIWLDMIRRCYSNITKNKNKCYKDVLCCEEWLCFENFYEWLHSQSNFSKWFIGERWDIEKDIKIKHNKLYSPDTCFLTPHNVNALFLRKEGQRGLYPIGVRKSSKSNNFEVLCRNNNECIYLGTYSDPIEGFYVYKRYKENLIKTIAKNELKKGNITKECYEAMIAYTVEITD